MQSVVSRCGKVGKRADHARHLGKREVQRVWAPRLDKHCKRKLYSSHGACSGEIQVRASAWSSGLSECALFLLRTSCLRDVLTWCSASGFRAYTHLLFSCQRPERLCGVSTTVWCLACYMHLFAWASRRQSHASLVTAERCCSSVSAVTPWAEAGTAPEAAGSVVSTGRRLLLSALATALAASPAQVASGPGAVCKPLI